MLESNARPGLNPRRLLNLMRVAIERCSLDLSGATVLTEAAAGAYSVTPILAALAGARVIAVTSTSRYGTVKEITEATLKIADMAGVAESIRIVTSKTEDVIKQADIVTNSGHVRPINRQMINSMKPTAVIPLM